MDASISVSDIHCDQLDSEPVLSADQSEKIGLKPILIYSQAQTGLNLCVTLIGLHLLYFYTDRRGLSPALAGLAFFIALVMDALTDPIVGNISDRARFKSGRRRPFFLAAIPMGICYFLLLSPPELHSGLFAWFLGFYFLMLTSRKLYETAYGALMPELTLDYDERTKLSTFRQLFATAGDISGALLPFLASYLFAKGTDFKVTGAVCAIVVAGGAIALFLGVREREEFSSKETSRLMESMKAVMSNRPFVILLVATSLAVMAINIPTVLIRFLAKYWYHDDGAAARWLIMYFAGSLVSYPFWFRITVRIEKKPAFVVAMVCNAICSLLFMTVSPSGWVALNLLMFLSGFCAIGIWITQISASADVIEWDEERTGQRQEGAYGGITSMAIKIAVAITLLLVGPVMSWIGYIPGVTSLPHAATENLRMLFAIGPAAIYFISALVFTRYPITRESHRAMRDRLIARGAAVKTA
jgi:glycoside/pentoside/hexuronide:cation symporter, GPH family